MLSGWLRWRVGIIMGVGRPLKFQSVADLQEKIDAYFAECDPHVVDVTEWVEARDNGGKLLKDSSGLNYLVEVTHKTKTEQVPYTITGLALALSTSRETLLDYEEREEFSDTIKEAKLKVENFTEQLLFSPSPTGPIFNLKNNYGWKDKTEQDVTSNGETIPMLPVDPVMAAQFAEFLKQETKE